MKASVFGSRHVGPLPASGTDAARRAFRRVGFPRPRLGRVCHAPLPTGERIVEYTGRRITKAESRIQCAAGNRFLFTLDDEWDLDGDQAGNPARFINHSCEPNCEAIQRDDRLWLEALRDIRPGEELSFDYGYDLENYREHPCRCGEVGCCGFVVAEQFRDKVRKLESLPVPIEEEERSG